MADSYNEKEYVQVRIPDKERLSRLLNDLKGSERTMAKYAEDCGDISASTLSRILNGKISKPLSIEVLRTLYEHRAEGVDFDFGLLAGANGMDEKMQVERRNQEATYRHGRSGITERREKEYSIQTTISNELFDRGKMIRVIRNPLRFSDRDKNPQAPDFGLLEREDFRVLMQDNNKNKDWVFEINMDDPNTSRFRNMMSRAGNSDKTLTEEQKQQIADRDMIWTINRLYASHFLIDAWEPDYMKDQKYSYVFVSEPYYDAFRRLLRNAQFHNEVTTILVDVDAHKVLKEEWMQCPQADSEKSVFDEPVKSDAVGEDEGHQFFFFFGDDQGDGE